MQTTREREIERVKQLKAKLQRIEARISARNKKERDGQLIAFGVLVEQVFKTRDSAGRQKLVDLAKKHLKDRTLNHALEGFERLSLTPPPGGQGGT